MTELENAPARVENALEEILGRIAQRIRSDGPDGAHAAPERLMAAMRYAVLSPGKRLRPTLVLGAAQAVGGRPDDALTAACAVEMIHAYSLVHDDLPSMDDDDMRRGRPSTHRQYDEATALLAGDGLLTEAFSTVTDPRPLGDGRPVSGDIRAEGARLLARAAGAAGMVGGQYDDVAAEGRTLDQAALTVIHRRKTGRLIQVSAALGALFGGGTATDVERLRTFGAHVGLAFQLVDDVLDGDGVAALVGDSDARAAARRWTADAVAALAPYGSAATPLITVAERMVARLA